MDQKSPSIGRLLERAADAANEALSALAGRGFDLAALTSPREPAIGHETLVLGTTGERAVDAGAKALERGGTAIDAALTVALTQVALAGGAWVSYAGLLNLLYFERAAGQVHCLNAAMQSPLAETSPLSIPRRGGRTALVPGFLAGVESAHHRFGQLDFQALFEPAIELASEGFKIDPLLGAYLRSRKSVLSRHTQTQAVFTKPGGDFYEEGDHFRQPALAETLRDVAQNGARGTFYEGDLAARLVAAIRGIGGNLTNEDLASYQPSWVDPAMTAYADSQVYSNGLPSFGGVNLIEGLNLLEQADLTSMGHYTESADALFWLMQISAAATLSWATPEQLARHYPGIDLSLEARTDKATAEALWHLLEVGEAHFGGRPKGLGSNHSDAVIAVDADGNVAVLVHSINTLAWGRTGLCVDGISISDAAASQKALIDRVGPGRRIPDATNPTIVIRSGEPTLAVGAIGPAVHAKTLLALHNALDFGMGPKEAVDAPAFAQLVWSLRRQSYVHGVSRKGFSTGLIGSVRSRGQAVKRLSDARAMSHSGFGAMATLDRTNHRVEGAVSKEVPGWGVAS